MSTSTSPLHDALTCTAPGVPLDASNLVLRAFDLFRRKTGLKQVSKARLPHVLAPMPLLHSTIHLCSPLPSLHNSTSGPTW